MNPKEDLPNRQALSIPRVSGDEPRYGKVDSVHLAYSPRERG